MAGFTLLRENCNSPQSTCAFTNKGLTYKTTKTGFFGELNIYDSPYDYHDPLYESNEDFIFCQGYVEYKNEYGTDALKAILYNFDNVENMRDFLHGQFTLIIYKKSTLYIISDYLGLSHVFHDDLLTFYTGSFVVATDLVTKKNNQSTITV